MSKISEQVQNQIKISEKVIASARTHAAQVANALDARLAAAQGPETQVSVRSMAAVITTLADVLAHATGEIRARELEYTAEQADDTPVRAARDATTQEVANLMTRLRSTVESALGREALSTYGLSGETPRVPRKLLNHVQNVAHLMRQKPANVETPFGASFTTEAAVVALRAKHAELETHIQDDDREARELEHALTQRDRAAATWADAYQGVAAALEGLYRLAGFRELAERVRPTQRALRGEEVVEESDSETDTEKAPTGAGNAGEP